MAVRATTLRLPIIIVFLLSLFGLFPLNHAEAKSAKKHLDDFVNTVTLGITTSEALTEFEVVEPRPQKLTEHIYGTKEDLGEGRFLLGLFSFCSDKLALAQAQTKETTEESARALFTKLKSEKKKAFTNPTVEEFCPTTEICEWRMPLINYSVVLNRNVDVITFSRRHTGLITSDCIQDLKPEYMDAMKKLLHGL